MGELANCPICNSLFVQTEIHDVCRECYKNEEKLFQKVYDFIRKRENRMAKMPEVVEATEVDEELISKWIRKGKLKVSNFPNLGYKCERCGTYIQKGKLCNSCTMGIKSALTKLEEEEAKKKEKSRRTYFHD
ncbi:TIGR03826 family flagellar region protein [Bacillus salitolerans]|uniref:TIGR03826 family flagellar region protein n=1 Tax=Bacillus salitolerans TaxID=1437434 RepID=A0ABW4LP14_9BACI